MNFLLFVRDIDDLRTACQQAGEFLAIRCRKANPPPRAFRVLGVWIHSGTTMDAPDPLPLRLDSGETVEVALIESFGFPGIWEFGRIEPVRVMQEGWSSRLAPDALPEALLSQREGPDGRVLYAPVFVLGLPQAQIDDEVTRLQAHYPLRIAGPVFHDLGTGLLSAAFD